MSHLERLIKNFVKKILGYFLYPKEHHKKLHLGAGGKRIDGWCNVDITWTRSVDVVDDIRTLKKFKSHQYEEIYACHVLEHFSHEEVNEVLKSWARVLKPGGTLRISVPDMDRIVKIYSKNWDHFQTPGHAPWIGLIYGGQVDPYDYHKTGFNYCWMKFLLEKNGFENVLEYPHEPHFAGIADGSLAKAPFDDFLSLNVIAKKRS